MDSFNVIGLNRRNIEYITKYNNRLDFPLVDNKILCKKLLNKENIPTPESFFVVNNFIEIPITIEKLKSVPEFVIKPARGRAGGGIKILKSVDSKFYTLSGHEVKEDEIKKYLGDILFGVYSFGKMNDSALIEYKINQHSVFDNFYSHGVSDIRIILLKDRPVMGMARIPTSTSDGKANLHQGALGIGFSLETGITTYASFKGTAIKEHPDTQKPLIDIQIPHYKRVVEISEKASKTVPLQYLGVDIVIDEDKGPLILEMNARPGLQIQVINNMGLGKRLLEIENET